MDNKPKVPCLYFKKCGEEYFSWYFPAVNSLQELYQEAVVKTGLVAQDQLVKVYWQGVIHGSLRGQC